MIFHIGDRVQTVKSPYLAHIVWEEASPGSIGVVVSELDYAPAREGYGHWSKAHAVEFAGGRVGWFVPECLRKIDDDKGKEPLGSWSECPWQPSKDLICR